MTQLLGHTGHLIEIGLSGRNHRGHHLGRRGVARKHRSHDRPLRHGGTATILHVRIGRHLIAGNRGTGADSAAGDNHRSACRLGALLICLLLVEVGEHILPFVGARRTVEGGEGEHQHLGAHTERQQEVAAGKMEDFEKRTPDDDGGTDGVGEVEETLAGVGGDPGRYAALVLFIFSHGILAEKWIIE